MRITRPVRLAVVGLVLVSVGCAKSSGPSTGGQTGGEPGGVVRTVNVRALDSLEFEPARITVTAGETVRFEVTNSGSAKHEFIVGDEQAQMAHEGQMDMGSSMQGSGMNYPSLDLAPGQTAEATVTFDKPTTLLYGCHQPGHYKGGMVGTIAVEQ